MVLLQAFLGLSDGSRAISYAVKNLSSRLAYIMASRSLSSYIGFLPQF
jgi:hypothetical protein